MKINTMTGADIHISVERCIDDADTWVWSLESDANGYAETIMDGYEGSYEDAVAKAKAARAERIEQLASIRN